MNGDHLDDLQTIEVLAGVAVIMGIAFISMIIVAISYLICG